MTFTKPEGEKIPYAQFGYDPQKVFYHIKGQVPLSISTNKINKNIGQK